MNGDVLLPPLLPDPPPKPPKPAETVTVQTKPRSTVVFEGFMYFTISALAPAIELLISDRETTRRAVVAVVLMGVVSGLVSLKAFFSQSTSPK